MSDGDRGSRYAIATDLLAPQSDAPWSNLGDWSGCSDYLSACRQLARRHGEAIALGTGDRLLDLACGAGASLSLWRSDFAVSELIALDLQIGRIAQLQAAPPPGLLAAHHARFDRLPLPAGLAPASCDAAICIDAAYHADSPEAFADFAAAALKPAGRLAFSTLLMHSGRPSRQQGLLLRLAGVPATSLRDAEAMRTLLAARGWQDIVITPLPQVLGGFADFVAQRAKHLSRRQRLSSGWLKIALTARLCRRLQDSGALRYSLISARRPAGS